MKDMNWPERVAYLENQLADSDRDNQRLREFIEGLPDGDEIVRLRGLLAETNAKMMILHNESISLHARLAEATGIISQRALELADTQGQLTEAKRDAARYRWLRDRAWPFEFNGNTPEDADAAIDKSMHLAARLAAAKKHTPECSYWDGLMAQVCNCGLTERGHNDD